MRLLLIDEDEISCEVLKIMLEDRFNLTILENLEEANSILFKDDFDIVLLDISSTKIDALALCKTIAGDSCTEPPLVLALGEEMPDEKIREVFEAGAYDFFVKPYNVVLFNESMHRLVNHIQAYQTLEESDKTAKNTMSIALAQASFYGFAFDLMADIGRSDSIEALSNAVLFGLSQRGVHCAIQISDENANVFTFEEDHDVVGERTLQVFNIVKDQGRIFRFGRRLMFSDDNVALLVKSMDDHSEVAYDCILDIGAKLIPCIQTRLLSIREHTLVMQVQEDMRDIIEKLHTSLTEQMGNTRRLIDNIVGQINLSIDRLELTEEQEAFFLNLVEKELHVESSEDSIQELEDLATKIYEKLVAMQNKPAKETLHGSQFGDVDLF